MSIQTNKLPDNPQIEVIKSGKTGLFTNYIYKAIPLAFDESMSYYETLLGLLHYLKNVILPTVNNNADAVAELQTLYEELRTYVDDYFKGLDVQEEINNKLDEMVEDGTLPEIIASYLNSKAVFGFDNVESMKNAENLINGSYAQTLGYHTKNDGGGSLYKITSVGTANEKDVISCQNGLVATLIGDGNYYPEQLGAYGDNDHDDTDCIQYILDTYKKIKMHKKTYKAKGIKLTSSEIIEGNGATLNGEDDTVGFIIYGNTNEAVITYLNVSNINLYNYTIGMFAISCRRSNFRNVKCLRCGTGAVFAGGCWINRFENCEFSNSTSHGFECGKEISHPITQATITPNVATFDFISCFFAGNGGYGATGWMREFNFIGGHSEANALGAFNILTVNSGGASRYSRCNTFIGVDIESVNIGYVFEGTGECEAEHVNIIGGQIDLNGEYEIYKGALVFKGSSCAWGKVHDINVDTRIVQGKADNDIYTIYCDGSTNSTIQADIKFTSRGTDYINTYNLKYIIPNGILRIQSDLPKRTVGGDYFDGTNIVLPAGKSMPIYISNLCFLYNMIVTTSASSTLRVSISGTYINGYAATGTLSASTTLDSGENKASFSFGNKADYIVITNETANPITITNIYLDAYKIQY